MKYSAGLIATEKKRENTCSYHMIKFIFYFNIKRIEYFIIPINNLLINSSWVSEISEY